MFAPLVHRILWTEPVFRMMLSATDSVPSRRDPAEGDPYGMSARAGFCENERNDFSENAAQRK